MTAASLGGGKASRADAPTLQGTAPPGFEKVDATITAFLTENKIPGAAFALAREGRLLCARGYGWGDVENRVPFEPTSLFRIASISKTITATAVLKLSEEGLIDLNEPVFSRLKLTPFVVPGKAPDPRLSRITVRHLLHHTGGWDRAKSFDATGVPLRIAREMKVPSPPTPTQIVRWMIAAQPLDFDPGSRFAYSNFGYLVLGRLIEAASGRAYGDYVQEKLLTPSGIHRMRLGKGRLEDRAPDEVRYYEAGDRRIISPYSRDRGAKVSAPYCFPLEQMDAHGGWLASVVDLVRFATAWAAPAGRVSLLNTRSRTLARERPAPPVGIKADGSLSPSYYGLGWYVTPIHGVAFSNLSHTGKLFGSSTELVRFWEGVVWALNFNSDLIGKETYVGHIERSMNQAIGAALRGGTDYPDLWDRYG